MADRVTIVKQFGFNAAHYFPNMPEGHRYRRMHGHSFRVEVALRGAPSAEHGWVQGFHDVADAIEGVRETLDHTCLNDIPGLENPSLEVLSIWIWNALQPSLPLLSRVAVFRDSEGEACIYEGPDTD